MPTISKLNVVLTGGIAGFSAAMKQAKTELGGFTSAFKSSVGSVAGAATGLAALLGGGLIVGGLMSMTKSAFTTIDANAKLSDTLGIATESLGKLQYAASYAGVSNEALSTGLKKMLKNLNEAQSGTGPAAEAFDKLGLSANDLINLAPDEAFAKIGGALNDVTNPAERVSATMEIFGKTGADLLPLLSEGEDGLKRYGEEALKFGNALNRVDSAKVEQANDAIQKVYNVLQGAINKLAVQMAPFLEAMANKIADLATQGRGLSGWLVSGFEAIVKGVAYATDYLYLFEAGWKFMQASASYAVGYAMIGLDNLGKALVRIANFAPGVHLKWTETFRDIGDAAILNAKDLEKQGGAAIDNFASGKNQTTVSNFFNKLRAESEKTAEATAKLKQKLGGIVEPLEDTKGLDKITDALKALHEELDTFGDSKASKAYHKIKELGGTESQLEDAANTAARIEALEANKKKIDEFAAAGKAAFAEMMTPLEKYNSEMEKLGELLHENFISQETYARASKKAATEFGKANAKEIDFPKLLEQGSQEAAKFVAEVQAKQKGDDATRELLRQSEVQNGWLGRIEANTKNQINLTSVNWN